MLAHQPSAASTAGAACGDEKLFKIDLKWNGPFSRHFAARAAGSIERIFSLDQLNGIYARVSRQGSDRPFMDRVLDDLQVSSRVSEPDLAQIPRKGPVVVVANHPFGAIEGILLAKLLQKVRPDVKIMANFLLNRIPELQESFIYVDPFGAESSARQNMKPLRECIQWLKAGGMLAVFPAGEVAHLDLKSRHVIEPAWSSTVARLVRKAEASVLPLFFNGHNGMLFQLLGLVHPRLRTAMLPRELLNKRNTEIEVRIGSVIPHRKLAAIERDGELMDYVRHRTFLLQHRPGTPNPAETSSRTLARIPAHWQPVIPAVDPSALAEEVSRLPAAQCLVASDEFAVYEASAQQVPQVMREIGRLREITYRATGEGTGKALDLDAFDEWYTHLFIWNRRAGEVVGAYRLGRTDTILAQHGTRGLYTSTLFEYKQGLPEQLIPALELGRSWVRVEYQRSYAPLLMLWKGIGKFVVNSPQYKILFGPVSISNDYQGVSKQLMVHFLQNHHGEPGLADLARAKNPFRRSDIQGIAPDEMQRLLRESDDVSDMVADLEPDQKGMPVLLRQYLKLGARFFAYSIDADFNDCLDALMFVDLTRTDPKILGRYMGKEGLAGFLQGVNAKCKMQNAK